MATAAGARAEVADRGAYDAYEALAAFYDEFTAGYAHDDWIAALERVLRRHGLAGRRVLDLACGTGKSTLPLVDRGYEVSACDLSPAMVEIARERLSLPPERVFVADMRALPALPEFDAVTCLDDSVNYLLEEDEVLGAFEGIARALRPGGLLVFDVNSLATYSGLFASVVHRDGERASFTWRGAGAPAVPGGRFSATVEIAPPEGPPTHSVHDQRHHPEELLTRLLGEGGLEPVEVLGQSEGARLSRPPDEWVHSKLVYVARRKEAP